MLQVHNKLGNTHHALMHFSWAMDLDPKGANTQIKDALDPTHNRVGQERQGVFICLCLFSREIGGCVKLPFPYSMQ